jgi:heat shock transcription factor 2
MVDTCDPSIAGWSDDGETFIVKDPVKFEKQIIPQFFKHSKFTSFVRVSLGLRGSGVGHFSATQGSNTHSSTRFRLQQLNFYAFRKIKYADSIRIDPKLEAETANYWRFRHEKFLRGKPELLSEIKRMNGQKAASNTNSSQPKVASALTPQEQENSKLKSEVSSLKERLEAMTKNIDELTSMVHKVTLATKVPDDDAVLSNKKRAKVEAPRVEADLTPDYAPSAAPVMASPDLSPCSATSCMELDAFALPPSMPSPHPMESRPPSGGSDMTDEGFVDYLFTAFNTEDLVEMPELPQPPESNRPRPELMNRLSDALSALPRDIQELIVDRLIQAIASPVTNMGTIEPCKDPQQIANLQLAAATLAALLGQCSGDSNKLSNNNNSHNALLIPVHA